MIATPVSRVRYGAVPGLVLAMKVENLVQFVRSLATLLPTGHSCLGADQLAAGDRGGRRRLLAY